MLLVKANESTAARRTVCFRLTGTDGVTPATGEANGQPQVSTDHGATWSNTGIGLLAGGTNGSYSAILTQTLVATAGTIVRTRYKSATTAEWPGDDVQVVAFDPYDTVRLGLTALPNVAIGGAGQVATGDASGRVTVITNNDKTGYALSAAGVQAVWDALTSALTTVGSVGKKLKDWVLGTDNKAMLSTDAQTGVTIPTVTTLTNKTGFSATLTTAQLTNLIQQLVRGMRGHNQVIFISDAGDDANDGLSPDTAVTYAGATNLATAGDLIQTLGRVYVDTIRLPSYTTLRGAGKGWAAGIYSNDTGAAPYVQLADHVAVHHLSITPDPSNDVSASSKIGIGYAGTNSAAIANFYVGDCTIVGNRDGVFFHAQLGDSPSTVTFSGVVENCDIRSDFDTFNAQGDGGGSSTGRIEFHDNAFSCRNIFNGGTYNGPRAPVGVDVLLIDNSVMIHARLTNTGSVTGLQAQAGGTMRAFANVVSTSAVKPVQTVRDLYQETTGVLTIGDSVYSPAKVTGTIVERPVGDMLAHDVTVNLGSNTNTARARLALADSSVAGATSAANSAASAAGAAQSAATSASDKGTQILEAVAAIDAGVAGPGADQVTLTFTSNGVAVPDADVWLTSDAAGLSVVAGTLQTDSNGRATFLLDDGAQYYFWGQKDGVNPVRGLLITAVAD